METMERYVVLSYGHNYYLNGDRWGIRDLQPKLIGFYQNYDEAIDIASSFKGNADFEDIFIFKLPKWVEKNFRKQLKRKEMTPDQCADLIWNYDWIDHYRDY